MPGTFHSATGGTFETAMPGTFHSATGGTFETAMPGTFHSATGGTFVSAAIRLSANGKTRKQQAHLLSDDEVDELAVLLGFNLYSAEDHRIFITDVTRMMIEGGEYIPMEKN